MTSLGPVRPGSLSKALLMIHLAGLSAPPVFGQVDTERLEEVIAEAHARFEGDTSGNLAPYIPALASADPARFAVVVVTTSGQIIAVGDSEAPFPIMSVAKPFTLALLMEQQGADLVVERIGVEPTGRPFNSLEGIDRPERKPLNPMVNAGAITAVGLLDAGGAGGRWGAIRGFYDRLAGEPLALDSNVYASVSEGNFRNRAIVNLLAENEWLATDPESTLDVYNRQSSVAVTARQLAVMGATVAAGGVNPITAERVMSAEHVDELLAVMFMAGMYEESGRWAWRTGLPAKSGVGGAVLAVIPGRMAIVGFSPRLNASGNSVRGTAAIEFLARELGLGVFEP